MPVLYWPMYRRRLLHNRHLLKLQDFFRDKNYVQRHLIKSRYGVLDIDIRVPGHYLQLTLNYVSDTIV